MTDVLTHVIRSTVERDDETGRPLFWSNEDGWVDRNSATVFSQREFEAHEHITMDSEWVPNDCTDGHDADKETVRPAEGWNGVVEIDCARCGRRGVIYLYARDAVNWSVEP